MPGYQVSLQVFEGPLDLLLRLIEQERLDITLVSLAVVTDQYLAYLAELQQAVAGNLAEFLAIAARLLVIKSRVLLPRPESPGNEEEGDWGEDLVERLREYRRFKLGAAQLREIEERGLRSYPRVAPSVKPERHLGPGELSPQELAEAFRRLLAAHPPAPVVDGIVAPVTVRIGECIQTILSQVSHGRHVRFSALMRAARSRLEVIVTFMAMLELIKQQRVAARQEQLFGEIYIEARAPDPQLAAEPIDLAEYGPS